MSDMISGYNPQRLFHHFEQISAIPRPSGHEKAVSDYVADFARRLGLEVHQDGLFNLVVKKPGSPGCEGLAPVMLQGHLDMVCEKDAQTAHDFMKEGIRLQVCDGILTAQGTTLGADNGVAVALMMAILEDDTLRHPPLECVFTVQEETGLTGAGALDPALLSARTMINLDSEEEGVATVSCAGGARLHLSANCRWQEYKSEKPALRVSIGGLLGGHSGSDIHLGRGNANVLMGRLLYAAVRGRQALLCSMQGGNKDNAIPRECEMVLITEDPADLQAAQADILFEAEEIQKELAQADKGFTVQVSPAATRRAMDYDTTDSVVSLLLLAPNGVLGRNTAQDFVVCSSNLGVICTGEAFIEFVFSLRSSADSMQKQSIRRLERLADLLDLSVEMVSQYPGWAYAEQSGIREVFRACYQQQTGRALRCEAIHAGLECGLFSGKLPGLDAIAVGPQIDGCHTPHERLDLRSFERFYRLLTGVLGTLAQPPKK